MAYQRVAHGNQFSDGSAADATVVINAIEAGLEAAETAIGLRKTAVYLDAYNAFFLGTWATGQGNTSTTLTAQATAGTSTLSVASGTGLINGTILVTNAGTATQQQYKITAGGGTTTLTVTPNVVTTLANGATIATLWTNSTHLTPDGWSALGRYITTATSGGSPVFTGATKITLLGDSWISTGATQLAAQFSAQYPAATLVNAGVSGNTSAQLIARFGTDVPTNSTHVLINEPGVNDIAGSLPFVTWAVNLDRLVALIRGIGAVPVILGVPPLSDWPGETSQRSIQMLAQTNTYPGIALGDVLTALLPGGNSTLRQTAFGMNAQLVLQPAGVDNTGIGSSSQLALTTGISNVGVGGSTQVLLVSGNNNTAVGQAAQQQVTGSHNTAVGQGAQYALAGGSENTAVGQLAAFSASSGSWNTAVGKNAMYSPNGVTANATTTGQAQTCVGHSTGLATTTQVNNILALGYNATVTAAGGVAIGTDSGGNGAVSVLANEIALGTANHSVRIRNNSTGAGSAALGANSPAGTLTAPYTWFKMLSSDGSTVYVPAWK